MKMSLVYLGTTGAGPVYSLEMAKALSVHKDCKLQVIVSSRISNLNAWNNAFENSNVDFHVIDTYKRSALSALIHSFNLIKQEKLVALIKAFDAEILYLPFGLMWARYVFFRLHNKLRIISTIHDVVSHDKWYKRSIAELGSWLLNIGSDNFVHGHIVLNTKDANHVKQKTGKDVCVIPHASFGYYFNEINNYEVNLKKCIGFFGRIEPYKGLDLLVTAFENSSVNGIKLLIAGSGTIDNDLLQKINNNRNIQLINRYIEDSEFEGLLESVDFVVLPYKRASQSGVIPMCFAAGKTVVATNVGALSEQVPEGTGVIVEPLSSSIKDSIDWFYVKSDKIFEYGKKAYQYAREEMSWNKSADLLMGFCKSIRR